MKFPLNAEVKKVLKGLIQEHGERDKPFAFAGRSEILKSIQEIANSN